MTSEHKTKPLPRPHELTRLFRDAAREGHLALQKCSDRGYFNHRMKAFCDRCSIGDAALKRAAVSSGERRTQLQVAGTDCN